MGVLSIGIKMVRQPVGEFVRVRICDRCDKPYKTYSRFSHVCPDCDLRPWSIKKFRLVEE